MLVYQRVNHMKSQWFFTVKVGDIASAENCLAPCLAAMPQKRRMIHNTMLKAHDSGPEGWELEGYPAW